MAKTKQVNAEIAEAVIIDKVHIIRGIKVMLDKDLAEMYGVEVKVLNQAVKRKIKRFPADFIFQLNTIEWNSLKSQIVTSKNFWARGHSEITLCLYRTRCSHAFFSP
jgi:ORF6N domain